MTAKTEQAEKINQRRIDITKAAIAALKPNNSTARSREIKSVVYSLITDIQERRKTGVGYRPIAVAISNNSGVFVSKSSLRRYVLLHAAEAAEAKPALESVTDAELEAAAMNISMTIAKATKQAADHAAKASKKIDESTARAAAALAKAAKKNHK